MFSAILDVALGIVLLYLILSLMASALNEVISARFQSRARTMEFFLSCLLFESVEAPLATYRVVVQRLNARIRKLRGLPAAVATDESKREMVSNFVNAPLLFAQLGENKIPNYIKAEDFAQAVFDFVRDQYKRTQQAAATTPAASAAAAESAAIQQQPPDPAPGVAVGGGGSPYAPAAGQAVPAPSGITNQPIEAIPSDDAFDFNGLSDAVTALPPDMPLKRVLSSIILRVREDTPPEKRTVDNVRNSLQQWYDNSMDRVSGWYKRDVQINLAIIGILLVVALNIDTIAVANRLLQDPALRDAVSSRAQTIAQQVAQQPALQALLLTPTSLVNGIAVPGAVVAPTNESFATPTAPGTALPAGTPTAVIPASVAGAIPTLPPTVAAPAQANASANVADLNKYIGSLVTLQGQINQLDVPIGWTALDDYPTPTEPFGNFAVWWFKKLIGLMVTVLAIMQGAPFWFDLLNKVTNLRLTGTPPNRADNAAG